jgi:NAD-dependent deacetylase
VLFGEYPRELNRIETALKACNLFVAIGTSGTVYPAAGFVETARDSGAKTLLINVEPPLGANQFDRSIIGKAGEIVPAWVGELTRLSAGAGLYSQPTMSQPTIRS